MFFVRHANHRITAQYNALWRSTFWRHFLYFSVKCKNIKNSSKKVHVKLCSIWMFEKIRRSRSSVMWCFVDGMPIIGLQHNIMRYDVATFWRNFLYFSVKCKDIKNSSKKVNVKLCSIWMFEKIRRSRSSVMWCFVDGMPIIGLQHDIMRYDVATVWRHFLYFSVKWKNI